MVIKYDTELCQNKFILRCVTKKADHDKIKKHASLHKFYVLWTAQWKRLMVNPNSLSYPFTLV